RVRTCRTSCAACSNSTISVAAGMFSQAAMGRPRSRSSRPAPRSTSPCAPARRWPRKASPRVWCPCPTAPRATDRLPSIAGPLRLGGPLLDPLAGVSVASNRALAEQGLAGLAPAVVRVLIGGGVPALIGRTVARLGAGAPAVDAEALLDRFTFHYGWINRHEEMQTRAYPGVAEGLAQLHALGLKLAVVTNKPREATIELLT